MPHLAEELPVVLQVDFPIRSRQVMGFSLADVLGSFDDLGRIRYRPMPGVWKKAQEHSSASMGRWGDLADFLGNEPRLYQLRSLIPTPAGPGVLLVEILG